MNLDTNNSDRIAELERQVRELTERLEGKPIVRPFPPKATACGPCLATMQRGGVAICGCTAFGPQITCAVA